MSIGWFSGLPDAETYYLNERLVTSDWDALTDAQKTKAINYSYNRLYHSPLWDLPTYAEADAAALVILRIANAEMAYYIIIHLVDEDRRKGIQAQAVIKAGIEEETYEKTWLDKLPIPASVEDLLAPWLAAKYLHVTNIDRDEDYGVSYTDVIDIED